MAERTLEVRITGNPEHLAGAFRKAGAESQTFGSKLRSGAASGIGALAKGAGFAALGIGVGLAGALKVGVSEFAVHQQASAQTQAALKSTGNAAHTSAAAIAAMSDAIEKKSGMDDIAIQSGANLLLTFTSVRNEAGRGNDIFNQATKTVADMSQALGQDTKSSAIQLGKALNDPIKGITALSRVGVSFTQGQKDSIKAMVAHGNTLGAQKVILKELNKEFGGSAVAAGKTLPGQLNILKARLSEVAQGIAEKLIPVLTQVVSWVSAHWPQISAVVGAVMSAVGNVIGAAVGFIRSHWSQILAATQVVIAWYRANVAPTITAVMTAVRAVLAGLAAFWARWGAQITQIVMTALNLVKNVIQTVLAVIRGDWSKAWSSLKAVVTGAFSLIRGVLSLAVSTLGALALAIGKAVWNKIKEGLGNLGDAVKSKLGALKDALAAAPGQLAGAALSIGLRIVDGILSGLGGLYGRLKSKLEGDLKGALKSLSPFSPVEHGGRIHIGEPLVAGALKGVAELGPKLRRALSQQVKDAMMQAKQNLASLGGSLSGTLNSLLDAKLGGSAAAKNLKDAQARQSEMDFQKQKSDLQVTISGGTDEEKAKAQASLDVLLAQRAFDLEQAKTDDQKQQNDRRLADLAQALNRGLISQKDYAKQVKVLMVGQGADYQSAGDQLGLAFADGFMAQLKDMLAQASLIAKARLPGLNALAGNVTNPADTVRGELATAHADRLQREHDARQKSSAGGVKVTHVEQVGIDAARAQERILQRILEAMTKGSGGDIVFNQTPANADPQAIAAAIRWARLTVSTA